MRVLILFVILTFLTSCANYSKHTLFNESQDQAYELEEVSSWGFFAPTYQYQRAKVCDVKVTVVNSKNSFGNGWTKREPVNCRLMTSADGYQKDLGSPAGPALLQAGGTVGAGALIGDGIRDSSDNINNTNQQGQLQGQFQYQKNYNSKRRW